MTPLILAEVGDLTFSNTWETILNSLDLFRRPDEILQMLTSLPIVGAAVVTAVGVACVFRGYKWHKLVVVLLSLMLGFAVGRMISQDVGKSTVVAISLGVLLAAIASPLLKYAVAVFAGIAGAGIGATAWSFFSPGETAMAWAGAGMGFITLALLSFIFFRIVVIIFTSVGGAAMMVMGSIALLLHIDSVSVQVREQLSLHPGVLPLVVVTAAVLGIVHQQGGSTESAGEED
jgi:hypothetical protein